VAVQKTACDLALSVLTRTRGSIGADIAGVDAEVCHMRADLESAKEDLQGTHTELATVQAEANRFSLALTGVKQDLEPRTCKTLEVEVKELRGEPQASTRGLTGVQCGRGEGCNAMSQQRDIDPHSEVDPICVIILFTEKN
jgi:hypothetical protein